MEKTIKQIADGLGVDKQRVYRFIVRNRITESSVMNQTKLYDETAQRLIEVGFNRVNDVGETSGQNHRPAAVDAVTAQLIHELEVKNKQIETLTVQLAEVTAALREEQAMLKASQALHAGTLQATLEAGASPETDTAPTSPEPGQSDTDTPHQKKGFFARLLGL